MLEKKRKARLPGYIITGPLHVEVKTDSHIYTLSILKVNEVLFLKN